MSVDGVPQRSDAPLPAGARPLFDRQRSRASDHVAESARIALGAILVNVAELTPDGTVRVAGWAAQPGARYERALAAARHLVPGADPRLVTFSSTANPTLRAIFLDGESVAVPFAEIARATVHPWAIRLTSMILELRWTISIPARAEGRIVGSIAAHLPEAPTDAQRSMAQAFAHDAGAALARRSRI